MAAEALDEVGPADHDSRLRAAEQLVAAEADEVGSGRERLLRRRLRTQIEQRARPEIVDERQREPPGQSGQLLHRRLLGETDDAEVRLVDAKQQRSLGAGGALVVGDAGSVGRSDLDEPGAGPREHLGDAEAVADLDQLAARDEHVAALRERGQREQDCGRVVVHDEGRLGTGQAPQERRDMVLPRAAIALVE